MSNELSGQNKWWGEGIQFQCQGSGKCCTSHGEFGYVFLTKEDRQRIAKYLGVTTAAFTRQYCDKMGPAFHLKEDGKNPDCLFLQKKRCSIYEARPVQCRTWPFWPEVMPAKAWKKEVVEFCPGVGKGKVWTREEIETRLKEQAKSEDALLKGV